MKRLRHIRTLLFLILVGTPWAGTVEGGDIVGTVKFARSPPPELLQPVTDHAVCGREPRPSDALLLSGSGGVKNAVVFIAHERMEGWRVPITFQMDQRRCTFVPRVLIIPPGATVEVLNSDGVLHNFHTLARVNPSLNLAQPGWAKPLRVTFEHPEIVQVKCDLHGEGFMGAWIVVANHPYYALTDADGRFRLPNVPVGPHTLEVWHEVLGTMRLPVSVGASGEIGVTVTFAGTGAATSP